jgi:hypothetical protein
MHRSNRPYGTYKAGRRPPSSPATASRPRDKGDNASLAEHIQGDATPTAPRGGSQRAGLAIREYTPRLCPNLASITDNTSARGSNIDCANRDAGNKRSRKDPNNNRMGNNRARNNCNPARNNRPVGNKPVPVPVWGSGRTTLLPAPLVGQAEPRRT